jgi:hypothetical protein
VITVRLVAEISRIDKLFQRTVLPAGTQPRTIWSGEVWRRRAAQILAGTSDATFRFPKAGCFAALASQETQGVAAATHV